MKWYLGFFLIIFLSVNAQDVSLYEQFNGRYDFTFIGNTLNPTENSYMTVAQINTSSSSQLNLNANDEVIAAYLYWAGCGTGDFEVNLNNESITAQRTFSIVQTSTNKPFFSAFANVTEIIQNTGSANYTLSNLDVTSFIDEYFTNRTNFAGWAVLVIYKNNDLPLNQINIYDGLQAVPSVLSINLDSLNVIDNAGAKIGFIAWEGDKNIQVNETLRINGSILSNPPLNPANNAFNGTNSVTLSEDIFNMDLDIYDIQNNILPGDNQANIELTSNQDYVMINTVITKLNSQLPDATITLENQMLPCNATSLTINYSVNNFNSTAALPANTAVNFYANDTLLGTVFTQNIIPINETQSGTITFNIPDSISLNFTLLAIVDENNAINETNETNNNFSIQISKYVTPSFNNIQNLYSCNVGNNSGIFNFSNYATEVLVDNSNTASFYYSYEDAEQNINEILTINNFEATTTPLEIFVRISNENCYAITSFLLITRNCNPIIYNGVTVNNDGANDVFFIDNLQNIFLNYKLDIYNRWGKKVWTGFHNDGFWNGYIKEGILSHKAPTGTYFYVLYLNDENYPKPISGYIYLMNN